MAHNFQGYDSYFILQYLREQGVKYDVIMRGAKVLSLMVNMLNIRFIDSLYFYSMRLTNLRKTFGIEELKKGHFPHFFNTKENENYVGPIPPVSYYNPDGMSRKDKEAFMTWHASMEESNHVPTSIFSGGVAWSFANCFTTSRTSIRSERSPSPQPVISCIAPITFPKIRSPSFHPWDIAQRTSNRCLPINGCRTRPKRTKFAFSTRVTAARNVSAPICSTSTIKKRTQRMKFTIVSGADARDVTPAIW